MFRTVLHAERMKGGAFLLPEKRETKYTPERLKRYRATAARNLAAKYDRQMLQEHAVRFKTISPLDHLSVDADLIQDAGELAADLKNTIVIDAQIRDCNMIMLTVSADGNGHYAEIPVKTIKAATISADIIQQLGGGVAP